MAATVHARAPGRVNLIGDHTDYNGGLAMPMAIDLATEVSFIPDDGHRVVLRSDRELEVADVDVDAPLDPAWLATLAPAWSRYVAAVLAVARPPTGGRGRVRTTVPVGAGLASSAALEVALALAFGLEVGPEPLARACQRAEQAATGVPSGLMDQLVVSAATAGQAMVIDFSDLSWSAVTLPGAVEVVVVDSGRRRTLAHTRYATRRAECEAAALHLGPLGSARPEAVPTLPDPVLRRRARHVVSECDRVRWMATALRSGDVVDAGRIMTASHRSLARDYEVSTPALDNLVAALVATGPEYWAPA